VAAMHFAKLSITHLFAIAQEDFKATLKSLALRLNAALIKIVQQIKFVTTLLHQGHLQGGKNVCHSVLKVHVLLELFVLLQTMLKHVLVDLL
jgi:uncharacterized membrane protein (DUF373 family)